MPKLCIYSLPLIDVTRSLGLFAVYFSIHFAGLNCLALDKLIKDVFADHEHIARPRCGDSQPVEVSIDVALRQIVELVSPKNMCRQNNLLQSHDYIHGKK